MTEPIDLTDKSKWADGFMMRNGESVRVVHRLNDGTIAVVTTRCDGTEYIGTRYADGRLSRTGESPLDLIPRPKKHSGWIAIAVNNEQRYIADLLATDIYSTEKLARIQAESRRWTPLAIIPISFFEGEGLDGAK